MDTKKYRGGALRRPGHKLQQRGEAIYEVVTLPS